MSHLDPERYEVVPVGITSSGAWVEGTRDFASLRIDDRRLPEVDDDAPRVAIGTSEGDRGVIRYSEGPRAGEGRVDRRGARARLPRGVWRAAVRARPAAAMGPPGPRGTTGRATRTSTVRG